VLGVAHIGNNVVVVVVVRPSFFSNLGGDSGVITMLKGVYFSECIFLFRFGKKHGAENEDRYHFIDYCHYYIDIIQHYRSKQVD